MKSILRGRRDFLRLATGVTLSPLTYTRNAEFCIVEHGNERQVGLADLQVIDIDTSGKDVFSDTKSGPARAGAKVCIRLQENCGSNVRQRILDQPPRERESHRTRRTE